MRFYLQSETEIVKQCRNVKYTEASHQGDKHPSPLPGNRPSEGEHTISPELESKVDSVSHHIVPKGDDYGDSIRNTTGENPVTFERLQPTEATSDRLNNTVNANEKDNQQK